MNTHFSRHTYLQVIRLSEVSRCPAGVYQAGCVVAAAAVVVVEVVVVVVVEEVVVVVVEEAGAVQGDDTEVRDSRN